MGVAAHRMVVGVPMDREATVSGLGLVGRFVSTKVARKVQLEPNGRWHDVADIEVCEVVACELETGSDWRLLVATHDGTLLSVGRPNCTLVPAPSTSDGPFR